MSIPQSGGGLIERPQQLAEYLERGCKPESDWRIGTEHEKFGFLTDTLDPLPYDGAQSVASAPVHIFSSLPGTLALLLWASGVGAVVGLVLFTVLAPVETTLGVGGLVTSVLWLAWRTREERMHALQRATASSGAKSA